MVLGRPSPRFDDDDDAFVRLYNSQSLVCCSVCQRTIKAATIFVKQRLGKSSNVYWGSSLGYPIYDDINEQLGSCSNSAGFR